MAKNQDLTDAVLFAVYAAGGISEFNQIWVDVLRKEGWKPEKTAKRIDTLTEEGILSFSFNPDTDNPPLWSLTAEGRALAEKVHHARTRLISGKTPDEARRLAADLIARADEIDAIRKEN